MLNDLIFRPERRRFPRSDGSTQESGATTDPLASSEGSSSPHVNVSDIPGNVTGPPVHTTNVTHSLTTAAKDDKSPIGIIAAVFITVVLVLVLIVAITCFIKKKGLWEKIFGPGQTIRRRSSTSGSRRPLDLDEPEGSQAPDHSVQGDADDNMFTIDDLEEDDRPDREEYFYDEVFGQSHFEDIQTQNSVRQLVSEGGDGDEHDHQDDELLDFDFETLGIKIDSYKIDDSRHRHV